MQSMTITRFTEEQTFRQGWMAVVLTVAIAGGLVIAVSSTLATGIHAGTIIGLVVFSVITFLLMGAKLTVHVSAEGLSVQYWPFHWQPQRIDLRAVASVEAVRYKPILEYGGWGIRYRRHGKAYNVRGNEGVLLTYRHGRTLLLGSQRAKELAQAIEQVRLQA